MHVLERPLAGAKQTFVAKLTSAKSPRPRKSQLSFDYIGNVATRSLIKETALCPVCAARFQSSSKAQTITERLVRATPSRNWIGEAKWNCFEIGAPAGRAQL